MVQQPLLTIYGCRLPTEWEWQAVADYDGSYTYGCGTTIDQSKANYNNANPLGLTSEPYTSPVNYYPSYGYGMNDMAGNILEWTSSSWWPVIRGGCWQDFADFFCAVSGGGRSTPLNDHYFGFRVCR